MARHRLSLDLPAVRVIAISAGKGGVGKSNVAINLAIALAQMDKQILLFDADLGLANIDIMLGLTVTYNLSHVINGGCHLSDIMLSGPCGIKIIPSASGTGHMTQLTTLELAGIVNAFDGLTDDYDYMLIDTAAGISDTVLSFARSSQEIIVVVCDEPTSLTDAYAFIKVMYERYEWRHFHVVANMIRSHREGRELFNRLYQVAEKFLDIHLNYLGDIFFDEHVHQAVKKQKAVILAFPDSPAAKAFKQLARHVEHWQTKFDVGGNTSFFLERLITKRQ